MHPFEELYNEISSLIKAHKNDICIGSSGYKRIVLLISPLVADKLIPLIITGNGAVYYVERKLKFDGWKFWHSPGAISYLKKKNPGIEFYSKSFEYNGRGNFYMSMTIDDEKNVSYALDVIVDPSMNGTKAKPVFLLEFDKPK